MLEDSAKLAGEDSNVSQTFTTPTRTEQLQELIGRLSTNYNEVSRDKTGRIIRTTKSRHNILAHDLALHESWLEEAHSYFRGITSQKESLTYASEWVLDNYYIIRQAIQQIEKDLPYGYYNQLPRLKNNPYMGYPRIYAIARDILVYQHLLLDPIELQSVLLQFQEKYPLTMGELWALPIFLRYGLIEYLSQGLVTAIQPETPPKLPNIDPILQTQRESDQVLDSVNDDAVNNNNIANIILSLRTISEQNWSDFFESVSCLERTLRKDPAGLYPQMDFKTRDIYRKEIEVLSIETGYDENDLGEITINLSLPNEHVGEVLLGTKRPILERKIGLQPDVRTSFKRFIFSHATLIYLSTILGCPRRRSRRPLECFLFG